MSSEIPPHEYCLTPSNERHLQCMSQYFATLIAQMKKKESDKTERKPLTKREKEILRMIASGSTGRQIAEKLFISERTVDTHRTHIRNKTRCRNAAELTRYAIENGILE